MFMEEYINKLKSIHERLLLVEREEREMFRPLLSIRRAGWLRSQVGDRDTFLLIAIRLFSPRCFIGQRMSLNIRTELGRQMGLGKTYVSKQIKLVLFRYEHMSSFRAGVNKCYQKILEKILEKNQ